MANYKTHQKELLLSFLSSHRESLLSVDEIGAELSAACPDAPGKSTVYRLIGRLYEEGRLRRFERGNSRTFVYQLVEDEECHRHLHLKCTECGRLLHMNHEQSEKILEEILGDSNFAVSQEDTTLFGTCCICRKEKTNGKPEDTEDGTAEL